RPSLYHGPTSSLSAHSLPTSHIYIIHTPSMAYSELLLLKPVEGLVGEGVQVRVRAGYARNFLLPQGFATPLTLANRKHVESLKKRRAEREAAELNGAQELARKIEKQSVAFAVKTGEGGKMF